VMVTNPKGGWDEGVVCCGHSYSYGRRRVDRKRTAASGGKLKMREVPMSEWMVLERDRLPA
jgi:hypothetical protein